MNAVAPAGSGSASWVTHAWDNRDATGHSYSFTTSPNTQPAVSWVKRNQTIDFPDPADRTFGDTNNQFTPTATGGGSTAPVTFAASATSKCSVSGTTVNITGAGSCTLTASQAGDDNYNAATSVTQSFNISKANQSITWGALDTKTFGDAAFDLDATASSSLGVSYGVVANADGSAGGKCSVSGKQVTPAGAGRCTIQATQGGNDNYHAAQAETRYFDIQKAAATVTLVEGSLEHTYNGTTKAAQATTAPASLETVTFSYKQGATNVPQPTNAGEYDVVATLNNSNYQGTVSGQLVILPAEVAGTFTVDGKEYDGDTVASIANRSLTTGVISGDDVRLENGTASFNSRHAGMKTVTGSGFALGGDDAANYRLASPVTNTGGAQISRKTVTGTIAAGDKVFDGTRTASATGVNPVTGVLGVDGVELVATNGKFDSASAGLQDVTADIALEGTHPGNYSLTASTATTTATISKASTTTVVECPADVTYSGTAQTPCTATVTGAGGLNQNPAVTYSNNTNAGTATADATYAESANHLASAAERKTFTINKAPTTTLVECPADVTYSGTAQTPCTATVTGAGGLNQNPAVTYSNNTNAGTATADATYAESANHLASADSKNFTIGKAANTVMISNLPANGVRVGASFTPTYTQVGDGTASTISKMTSVCTVGTDGKVSYIGAGTCTLQAAATESTNYTAATGAEQSFRVDASTVWTLKGFYAPIGEANSTIAKKGDEVPAATTSTVWNTAKGGSTIPLKFNVAINGTPQTSTGTDVIKSFTATKLSSCPGTTVDGIEELSTAGITGLRYDTNEGQYVQTWKTSTVSGNTCFRVALTTADDSVIYTFVQLRK